LGFGPPGTGLGSFFLISGTWITSGVGKGTGIGAIGTSGIGIGTCTGAFGTSGIGIGLIGGGISVKSGFRV
jgi:hypothetical protein